MNKIINSEKIKDMIVLDCDFETKIGTPVGFRIYKGDGDTFEIKEYQYERFTSCFTDKDSTPSIITKTMIPDSFLQKGNLIEKIIAK